MIKVKKTHNQLIDCTVHDCDFCNCLWNKCKLNSIKICNCHGEEGENETTMCASYKKRED